MSNNTVTTNSNDIFIKASEVATVMNVSRAYAYRIVKQLNEELAANGILTVDGRTNRKYFYERLYGTVSA
jgi:hypothetical protein